MITVSKHIDATRLASFKKQLLDLHTVLQSLSIHWNHDKIYSILAVLLQNASSNSVGCFGYTHEKEIIKTNTALDAIEILCNYNKFHVTEWLLDEIDTIHIDIQHS